MTEFFAVVQADELHAGGMLKSLGFRRLSAAGPLVEGAQVAYYLGEEADDALLQQHLEGEPASAATAAETAGPLPSGLVEADAIPA